MNSGIVKIRLAPSHLPGELATDNARVDQKALWPTLESVCSATCSIYSGLHLDFASRALFRRLPLPDLNRVVGLACWVGRKANADALYGWAHREFSNIWSQGRMEPGTKVPAQPATMEWTPKRSENHAIATAKE